MVVVWLTGPYLAYREGYFAAPWLHAKLALVLILSATHGYFARLVRIFAADANTRPARFYRFLNEFPTLLMIGIVILVIVKPF
jgi:putative membrane protein